MNTPIIDFVKKYIESNTTRFHMPGHKGRVFFCGEPYDITEIPGADVLHHGSGIIWESEKNASRLFGSGATHYSTEGSSHCVKSMLAILKMAYAGRTDRDKGQRPYLLAARNVHRSMIDGCALLDLDVEFVYPKKISNLCSTLLEPEVLEEQLEKRTNLPLAVYITSPDYLGQVANVKELATVCKKYGIPLVVDNAHGAYLHFLEEPVHPMDLGAAMCCDSAHKTLPVLTGGAYLHISREYLSVMESYANEAMSLFGSTSPSYLIMESLDLCNGYLAKECREELKKVIKKVEACKALMTQKGICVMNSEKLKIVIDAAAGGYTGEEIARELERFQIECEYADKEYVVLMVSPQNEKKDWKRLENWASQSCLTLAGKAPLPQKDQVLCEGIREMTIRQAVFQRSEQVSTREALGRICAVETIACPPAIPIAVCGERINEKMIQEFLKYDIEEIRVVREN